MIATQSGRSTRNRPWVRFVTNALPARPACHSIREISWLVVAFGHGDSNGDSARVPNVLRGLPLLCRPRNVNRACERTSDRTIWAAKAGGQRLSAAEYDGSVA